MSAASHWVIFCAGMAVSAVALVWAATSEERDCPNVYDIALFVSACQAGNERLCERLDTSISAKCLLERGAEAGDIVRPAKRTPDEILL